MKILFAGGGTSGSVSPLIAIYRKLKETRPDAEVMFIGTRSGNPEREMIKNMEMSYVPIFSGKFRRYFDLRNISDIILIFIGFIQSLVKIGTWHPDLIVCAGSFVSVPVVWAGWVWQSKILIHQQDIRPSLSNIFTMRFATAITVSFEESKKYFPAEKCFYTGNPPRFGLTEVSRLTKSTIQSDRPVVTFVGGGTGAAFINEFVHKHFDELISRYTLIHITGRGKQTNQHNDKHYHTFDFVGDELLDIFERSDVVVSRAGLSTLTELSFLKKPTIVIPLPDSHQLDNARFFADKGAVLVFNQSKMKEDELTTMIREVVEDDKKKNVLSASIGAMMKKDAVSDMMKVINHITGYET